MDGGSKLEERTESDEFEKEMEERKRMKKRRQELEERKEKMKWKKEKKEHSDCRREIKRFRGRRGPKGKKMRK